MHMRQQYSARDSSGGICDVSSSKVLYLLLVQTSFLNEQVLLYIFLRGE